MTPKEFITKIQELFAELQRAYPNKHPVEDKIRYENEAGCMFGTAYSIQENGTLCPFGISYKGKKYKGWYYIKVRVGMSGKVQCSVYRGTKNDIMCNPHTEVRELFRPEDMAYIAQYIIQNADRAGLRDAFIDQINWEIQEEDETQSM